MRPYHSASSVKTGMLCEHLWALTYLDGIRDPDIPWSDIESGKVKPTSKQRSLSLGKAVHAVGEAYYGTPDEHEAIDWSRFPAQVYESGVHLLPAPQLCSRVAVETGIGTKPLPPLGEGKPTTYMPLYGVRWAGFRDLVVVPSSDEISRLGLRLQRGEPLLLDYKTSSCISKYALTRDELRRDLQACLYAYATGREHGHDRQWARWLYLESKGTRRSLEVDVRIDKAQALEVIEEHASIAKRLDQIPSSAEAQKNPAACGMYGGCARHVSKGGTCEARIKLGALAQLLTRPKKKELQPMIPEELKKKHSKFAKKTETDETEADEADEADETETDETEADAGPPSKPSAKAKPPKGDEPERVAAKAATKAAAKPRAPKVKTRQELLADLEAAEASVAAAKEALRATL